MKKELSPPAAGTSRPGGTNINIGKMRTHVSDAPPSTRDVASRLRGFVTRYKPANIQTGASFPSIINTAVTSVPSAEAIL